MNDSQFAISVTDMGGWVRVYLGSGEPMSEFAIVLSRSLNKWMKTNPMRRVRMIVPITSNGDTSELHAWYDVDSVPDVQADAGNSRHESV